MSDTTKLVKSFLLKAPTLDELAKKTEDFLWKNPNSIVLTRYSKTLVKKQVFDRYYRHQATGDEKRVLWFVKIGVVE